MSNIYSSNLLHLLLEWMQCIFISAQHLRYIISKFLKCKNTLLNTFLFVFARNSYYILMKIFNIFFYECRLLGIPLCLNIFFMMTWFNMYILIKCHKCFKMFLKLLLPQYWYQEHFSKKKYGKCNKSFSELCCCNKRTPFWPFPDNLVSWFEIKAFNFVQNNYVP